MLPKIIPVVKVEEGKILISASELQRLYNFPLFAFDSNYVNQKVQKLTNLQTDLPSQAHEILAEGKGFVQNSTLRILGNELELYKKGKENELEHYLAIAKKQLLKTAEVVEQKENRSEEECNFIMKNFSLPEIQEKLTRNKIELEKVTERWNKIPYPKGRTQRVATLSNRMQTLTHEIFLYEQILAKKT